MSAKNKRLTPQWKRNTLNTAVLLAISGTYAAPTLAAICGTSPVTISTAVGPCTVSLTDSITITGAVREKGVRLYITRSWLAVCVKDQISASSAL